MLNLLRKQKLINKIKYSRSLQDADIFGVTISSHVIYFRFLRQLRKTKIDRFEAEELAVTGEKIFDYLKSKDFYSRSKKLRILLITCELVSATMSIALF